MPNNARRMRRNVLLSTVFALPFAVAGTASAQPADGAGSGSVAEVVVTATRQSTAVSKVPISITAYTEQKMVSQGIKGIADLSSFTPGVSFSTTAISSNISVRGIASSAGSATTGVYIDDTPIQVRVVGTSSANFYPILFDLARVEVLRGPQGTLFGAGSEGGALRFILPEPSLTHYTGYGRGEVGQTEGGAPSYEAGFAVGGPIIEDKLGFRASAYYRRDGGWIQKVAGSAQVLDSTGHSGINSVLFAPSGVVDANANWQDSEVFHLAFAWKPLENLKITPSIFYQNQYINDNIAAFWPAASNYDQNNYVAPQWIPQVDANHIALPGAKLNSFVKDRMALPSLHIDWSLGKVDLISNTSGAYREQQINPDYTMIYETTYAARGVPVAGDFAVSPAHNLQQNFTQELRAQTPEPLLGRLNLVGGLFYTRNKQTAVQNSQPNFISTAPQIVNQQVPGVPSIPPAVNNGAPFGPGYSAYINYYGVGLLNGVTSYYARIATLEEQEAAFANADFNVTSQLKLTGGVRVSENSVTLAAAYAGPNSNLNTPHGLACVPGTGLSVAAPCMPVAVGQYKPGQGPFAAAYVVGSYGHRESSVTPKYGIEYQLTPNDLYYVSVSKGFRAGGAQQMQPSTCNAQLVAYGFVNAQGRPAPPTSYNADSVWSYEVGAKDKLFGGRLQTQLSIYHIDWSNIQTSVSLNSCSQSIIDNLGGATSNGFDLQADFRPIDPLLLSLVVGYTNASFNHDTVLGGRKLFSAGSAIPNSPPPVQATFSGQYDTRILSGIPAYGRFDYRYQGAQRHTGATDNKTVSFNAYISPPPATHDIDVRAGVKLGPTDLSFFIKNLTDEHPHLALTETINQPLYTDITFRPRTFGVTATYGF